MPHQITDRERRVYLQDLKIILTNYKDEEPYITNTFRRIELMRIKLLQGKYIRQTKPTN